ncbi:MAG: HEAT repeat domain-containing protein [Gemmatimonadota bacterium]|nr:HEAT repeat domain-containing protein [Gemmatimonadota bacterium]
MQRVFGIAVVVGLGLMPTTALTQTLAQQAATTREGTIRFSFAAREGVCGRDDGRVWVDSRGREWESECEEGPVRIAADVEGGVVVRFRTCVGGRWRDTSGRVEELGTVGVGPATAWLEALASAPGVESGDAVFPLTLADSIAPGPALIRIAKSTSAPGRSREGAVFWLGQVAGTAATAHLEEVVMSDDNRKLRDAAVFALSQLRDNEGVPSLLRLARTNTDPKVRRSAFFWLGQSKDPRALALFEEILVRP